MNSTPGLMKVLRLREALLFQRLGSKMAAAGKAGVFDTWMLEESDLIQAAARAYGDRLIADRFTFAKRFYNFSHMQPIKFQTLSLNFRFGATVGSCDSDLKPILEKVLELYLASNVERNLAQLLTLELIKPQQVQH